MPKLRRADLHPTEHTAPRCPRCGTPNLTLRRCKRLCVYCGYQECCADACLIEYPDDEAAAQTAKPVGNRASRG